MSGHSKWSTIKHKKSKEDAKRGKLFTKLQKEIMVAARLGGGDPEANPRLRTAIAAARSANMPNDNIQRAIKRGTGELPGVTYEQAEYEGYGPGGIAVLVECLSDNKNRTVAELRNLFSKHGGNIGEAGCVSWMFEKKGLIHVEKSKADEEALMEKVIEAGAEDMKTEDDIYEIVTDLESFESVKKALNDASIPMQYAEITMVPKNTVKVDGDKALKVLKLMDVLEDHDDVQHVYSNFDIPDEVMKNLQDQI
ncbi:MAG: YebC/PmpR family DNA-binding transcriptional regulator [Candidatus Schekmanbacteria bacterium]|nr:MAG: YebC/PmpR family DNA-binding transcriptional regulator [Candidatus Schekmanbacteria bacterium]